MYNQFKVTKESQLIPITFDSLPQAVNQLFLKLDNIERLLQQNNSKPDDAQEEVLVIDQASKFLHLSLPTIYALVSNRKIPFMKKGKRLYFSKKELTKWLYETKREAII